MKIADPSLIEEPLITPQGEIIAELIGTAAGDAANHSLARIIIPPGKSSVSHFHQAAQETYFILKGKGSMTVDDRSFVLLPGQACWIEAGEVHQIRNQGETDLVLIAVCTPAWTAEDSFEVGEKDEI